MPLPRNAIVVAVIAACGLTAVLLISSRSSSSSVASRPASAHRTSGAQVGTRAYHVFREHALSKPSLPHIRQTATSRAVGAVSDRQIFLSDDPTTDEFCVVLVPTKPGLTGGEACGHRSSAATTPPALASYDRENHTTVFVGAAPDGVKSVDVTANDGSTSAATVTNNQFSLTLTKPVRGYALNYANGTKRAF